MSSRKLLALQFIQDYWARRGCSPSFGEIGAALGGISNSRVSGIVRSLAAEGRIGFRPGAPKSITLPSSREEALRILRAEGWSIDQAIARLAPPAGTDATLLMPPELDHIPYRHGGDQHDDNGGR